MLGNCSSSSADESSIQWSIPLGESADHCCFLSAFFSNPLIRALRRMNDRELTLSIILGLVIAIAGLADLLGLLHL
jgi:hypothetical protein